MEGRSAASASKEPLKGTGGLEDDLGGMAFGADDDEIWRVETEAWAMAAGEVNITAAAMVKIPKKKPQADLRFLVELHDGKDDRLPITRETYEMLIQTMNMAHMDAVLEGKVDIPLTLDVDWQGYSEKNRCGLIACLTEETCTWIKKFVDKFAIGKQEFRAWSRGERGNKQVARMYLGPEYKACAGDKVVNLIMKLNPIPGEMKFLGETTPTGGKGRFVRVLVDGPTAEWLTRNKGKIKLGMSTQEMKLAPVVNIGAGEQAEAAAGENMEA